MKNNDKEQSRIHIHQSQDEVVEYQKREKRHDKRISVLAILFLIWIGVFFISLFMPSYEQWVFSIAWIFKQVSTKIEEFYRFVTGQNGISMALSFYAYLNIALAGAALATCGTVFQGSMKNVLMGPSTMGVMSGGTLGCLIYVMFFIEKQGQSHFFVLGGCFFSVTLVLLIATLAGKGKASPSTMLICGMVFSSVVSNITMIVQYYLIVKDPNDARAQDIKDLMMGNFNRVHSLSVVLMMGIPILICFGILIAISNKLNLLSLGDDEAAVAGLNVRFYRSLMILLGTILTAIVVSFCGQIGFIGFMVPMITRKIAGPDMKKLVPASMLVGAILLTVIYDVAAFCKMTDYMNVFTSIVGCIVMTITLIRGKKGGRANAAYKTAGK